MENNKRNTILIYLCWVISSIATLGSLFFSEVMQFTPCVLCWYQRIAMYPLVVLFLVGSFRTVRDTICFSLPLVAIGWIIAVYHNLLHLGVIPESASPCIEGASCSTIYLNWFGFVTIPLLSFFSFSLIGIILIYIILRGRYEK